jgi:type IV pilus assembly protein PilV
MTRRVAISEDQRGVVLIEVLVAALVFAIGILAVIGLQAAAIANVADAKFRVDASNAANELLGKLWANQSTAAAGSGSVSNLPNGTYNIAWTAITDPFDPTANVGHTATVTVTWQPPNATAQHSFSAKATVYQK